LLESVFAILYNIYNFYAPDILNA